MECISFYGNCGVCIFLLWLQTHLRQARFCRPEFGAVIVCLLKRLCLYKSSKAITIMGKALPVRAMPMVKALAGLSSRMYPLPLLALALSFI